MSVLSILGAVWGVLGVVLLLASAVFRLSEMALEIQYYTLSGYQWLLLCVNTLFMLYSEGYKGFQKKFSPRVVARACHIYHSPRLPIVVFAPFFCVGLLGSTTKRKVVFIVMTLVIVLFVILIRQLSQPWRGIIDVGVVVGLSWGILSILYYCVAVFVQKDLKLDPELPD